MKLQYQLSLYIALIKKGYYSLATFKKAKKQIEENINNNLENPDKIKFLINESVSLYKDKYKMHFAFFLLLFNLLYFCVEQIVVSNGSNVSSYNAPATTTTSEDYTLDSFTNQSANFVKSKLESKSINVQIIGNGSTVLEQYPEATTQVTKNDRVFLKTESADITIPNFTGWSRKDVSTYASLSGINITIEGESGQVASQSVPEGTILHAGDTMTVAIQ